MSFPSKFKGKCKDCSTEWAEKEKISKNGNGNWCKNGMDCKAANVPSVKTTQESPKPTVDVESKADTEFKSFLKHEINILKEIEQFVKDDLGSDANPARIGMYIKELYCANKTRDLK